MSDGQIQALRGYIQALELENKSKSFQQDVLHRQLQILNSQLVEMQQYYFKNREMAKEMESLRLQSQLKYEEIDKLMGIIQQMEENISRNGDLQALLKQQQKTIEQIRRELAKAIERQEHLKQILDVQKSMSAQQKDYNNDLKTLLQSKEIEIAEMKNKIKTTETATSDSPSFEKGDCEYLRKKIEQLEEESEEREEKLKELEEYIDQLEYCCESLNNNMKGKQIQIKQLRVQLSYLQKQCRASMPMPRRGSERFHRSQVSTPKWKQNNAENGASTTDRALGENHKQNFFLALKSPSENLQRSECSSVRSINQQANKLQKRNSILKRQNQMLLRGMAV